MSSNENYSKFKQDGKQPTSTYQHLLYKGDTKSRICLLMHMILDGNDIHCLSPYSLTPKEITKDFIAIKEVYDRSKLLEQIRKEHGEDSQQFDDAVLDSIYAIAVAQLAANFLHRELKQQKLKKWIDGTEAREARIQNLRTMPYQEYLKTNHWKRKREKALERDDYCCHLCSTPDRLHVHHRTYERRGCELPEDLVVLCENCHAKHHDKLPKEPA